MAETVTAVVTGANRGIGFAVAAGLVRQGCRVVLVTRNRARGEQAVAALGVPPGGAGGSAELVVGDLSVLSSIRAVAAELHSRCDRIDVLVHNAGVWPTRLVRTEDGYEQSFAVNHLAPFLLNHLLEERLRRVVQVSAGLYVKGRVDPDRTPRGADFHRMRTYCDTKLANLLTVPLFAEHWKDAGVTIDAVHPGVIRTGLGDPGGVPGLLLKAIKRRWEAPAVGAARVARLAFAPGGESGRYFDGDRQVPLAPVADDPALARRLWDQGMAHVA
ncbi:SDR family NAD(P)-dependent oxidoreductase [Micromonospora sp. NPDC047670]|uniref:SDR family NAD(P)-dependent oxidoreductase n=1 Tax=Micromonospora sp. NPDC047670 TaxID=3364252 RepID=UPI00371ADC20